MANAISVSTSVRSNTPWLKVFCLIAGICAISAIAFLLNRDTYAIGDDYHIYAFYFVLQHNGFFSAVRHFLASPYAAGRPIAIPFDVAGFSLISSIYELNWLRYLHLAFLAVIFILLGEIAKNTGLNTILSYLIALTAFLQIGVWHLFMVTYGAGILAGMIAALLASSISMRSSLSKRDWLFFTLLAAWAIFSYQSIWPLILLGITVRLLSLSSRTNRARQSKCLSQEVMRTIRINFTCLVIVMALILINYLIARFAYESPRLHSGMSLGDTFHYVGRYLVEMTIYPWVFFWYRDNYYVFLASWITIGTFVAFATAFTARLFLRASGSIPVFRYIDWRGFVVGLSLITALLPLSLGMYLFTDQALAFRRVTFASIFFWYAALVMAFSSLPHLRTGYLVAIELCFAAVVFCGLFLVGSIMDTGTQQVAAREWFAATCAAKLVSLTEPISINRPSALAANPKPFPHGFSNNEVQVRTLAYPAGAMLIWLSQKEVNKADRLVTPWKIGFADDAPLNSWDLAFAKCAAEYKK
jgi:hypothetical protein